MDYFFYLLAGIIAGALGGMMGIGGSIIIIPALILLTSYHGNYSGTTQHLIQAVGMLCNVFISLPAAIGHWRSGAVTKSIVSNLVPAAIIGIILGVSVSNISFFAGDNGKYLTILLGVFLFYVGIYNLILILRPTRKQDFSADNITFSRPKTIASGLFVGLLSGLLGIGGGSVCIPCQQVFLKVPLRNAIANSSCTIVSIVLIGAIYKNATLAHHGLNWREAITITACIVPLSIVSSYFATKLTHNINQRLLQILFTILLIIIASITLSKGISSL